MVASEVEAAGRRAPRVGGAVHATSSARKAKLKLVVPVTLAARRAAALPQHRSLVETGIVLLAVPFSLIGAVWLLWLLDYNLSVAVWVGLIALAGLDAETGVVMLLYLKLAWRRAARRRAACATLRRPARGDRRGRGAAHPAQADDRADHDDRPGAGPVVAPAPAPT